MDGNSLVEFPILTENDLYFITYGTYQRRLGSSYYAEHVKEDADFEIQVCKHTESLGLSSTPIQVDDPLLVCGRIHSPFRNSTLHFLYMLVEKWKTGMDSILEYCCQCKNCLRTVGCCVHVMTDLWYLGLTRYQAEIPRPENRLNEFYADLSLSDEDTGSE
jgi:hypothetical protein